MQHLAFARLVCSPSLLGIHRDSFCGWFLAAFRWCSSGWLILGSPSCIFACTHAQFSSLSEEPQRQMTPPEGTTSSTSHSAEVSPALDSDTEDGLVWCLEDDHLAQRGVCNIMPANPPHTGSCMSAPTQDALPTRGQARACRPRSALSDSVVF